MRKARALKSLRREEYEKAQSSTNRSLEEQSNAANKQLEKKRRLEEEALQKVGAAVLVSVRSSNAAFSSVPHTVVGVCCFGQADEAEEQYQSCLADAGVRKMDLANAKSTILAQIRKTVFQCDLTLKAVSR